MRRTIEVGKKRPRVRCSRSLWLFYLVVLKIKSEEHLPTSTFGCNFPVSVGWVAGMYRYILYHGSDVKRRSFFGTRGRLQCTCLRRRAIVFIHEECSGLVECYFFQLLVDALLLPSSIKSSISSTVLPTQRCTCMY